MRSAFVTTIYRTHVSNLGVEVKSNRGYNKSFTTYFFPAHILNCGKMSHTHIAFMINYHHVCWLYAAHCCAIFCTFHPIPKLLLPILSLQHQWNIPVRLDAMLICWVCLRIEDPPTNKKENMVYQQFPISLKDPVFFVQYFTFLCFCKIALLRVIPTMKFQDIYFDTYSDIFPNILSDIHSRRKLQESNLILGNVLWQPVWHMYLAYEHCAI
jgi:hypothetical protein